MFWAAWIIGCFSKSKQKSLDSWVFAMAKNLSSVPESKVWDQQSSTAESTFPSRDTGEEKLVHGAGAESHLVVSANAGDWQSTDLNSRSKLM